MTHLYATVYYFTKFSKHIPTIISQNILAIKKGDPFVKSFIKSEMGKVRCSVPVNILCRHLNDDGIKRFAAEAKASAAAAGREKPSPLQIFFNSILLKRGLLC